MKILFLNPPPVSKYGNTRTMGAMGSNKIDYCWQPIDLLILSGYLRQEGFDNDVIDANAEKMSDSSLLKLLNQKQYDFIVCSTGISTIDTDMAIINKIKKALPKTLIAAIGTFVMSNYSWVLQNCKGLDIAIYSEPEEVCLNIVKHFSTWYEVKGIAFRTSEVEVNEPEKIVIDINKFGLPAHDKVKPELYYSAIGKTKPMAMIMPQRGCVNRCTFCCMPAFWKPYRARSPDSVVKEILWLKELGYNEYMFNDAEMNGHVKWSMELFQKIIDAKIDMPWTGLLRARDVPEELIRLMKESGCYSLALGVESIDEKIIKAVKKNYTLEELRFSVNVCKKYKIDILLFVIYGLNGETKETMKATFDEVKRLNPDYATFGIAVPTPGTPFYDYINENDFWVSNDIKEKWELYDPMKAPLYNYPNLSSKEMWDFSRYSLKKFYASPQHLFQRISKIRDFEDFKRFIKNGMEFTKRYLL